jgi:hypothetical protein
LLAASSFTLITLGKSGFSAGLGAGFSSVTTTAAAVSVFGGTGAGFSFLGAGSVVLLLAGVTEAVLEGTFLLPQLVKKMAKDTVSTISIFLNIRELYGIQPKIMPMKFPLVTTWF